MIIKENGKTFEGNEPYWIRIHDEKWEGKRTTYTRCNICGKLVGRQGRDYHKGKHVSENHENKYIINF